MEYGTFDILYQGDEPIAAIRYNISTDGRIADILDLIIAPDQKGIRIVKILLLRGWKKFPGVRYLRFYRGYKYPLRKPRLYPLEKFFHLSRGA